MSDEENVVKMERWNQNKIAFFEENRNVIKYWETPLRKISFLKIFDKILYKCGIKLVHKPIDYITDYKYNTNILLSYRKVNKMVSIIIKFDKDNLPLEIDFDMKFSEFLDSIAKKTTYFRDLDQDDIIIYDKVLKTETELVPVLQNPENPEAQTQAEAYGNILDPILESQVMSKDQKKSMYSDMTKSVMTNYVESISLRLTQVESEKDFQDFVDDFGEAMRQKYGKGIIFKHESRKTFFQIHLEDLGEIKIEYMNKRKEKLVKMGKWAYYLPGGWISYGIKWKKNKQNQINECIVAQEKKENLLKESKVLDS